MQNIINAHRESSRKISIIAKIRLLKLFMSLLLQRTECYLTKFMNTINTHSWKREKLIISNAIGKCNCNKLSYMNLLKITTIV